MPTNLDRGRLENPQTEALKGRGDGWRHRYDKVEKERRPSGKEWLSLQKSQRKKQDRFSRVVWLLTCKEAQNQDEKKKEKKKKGQKKKALIRD